MSMAAWAVVWVMAFAIGLLVVCYWLAHRLDEARERERKLTAQLRYWQGLARIRK